MVEVHHVGRPHSKPSVRKHLNKIAIQGVVVSDVKCKKFKSGTQTCAFKIISRETFKSKGKTNWHDNEIIIEALGSQARIAKEIIRKGGEYIFDGYLRSDKVETEKGKAFKRMRVRIYHIEAI